jgi:hypothetical protein
MTHSERDGSAISPTARLYERNLRDQRDRKEAEERRQAALDKLAAEQAADDQADKDRVIPWQEAVVSPVPNPQMY